MTFAGLLHTYTPITSAHACMVMHTGTYCTRVTLVQHAQYSQLEAVASNGAGND